MKFAVVGCGGIASTHVRALQSLGNRVQVSACCDVEPDRASTLGERFGLQALTLEEVFSDPTIDAVTVCTPSALHAELGIAALFAGKHVLVEKPMAVTVNECDRLLEAESVSGRRLGVVSQRRFDPTSQLVKRLIDSGDLGAVIHADCRVCWYRSQGYYDSGLQRGTWSLDGGGCLMNQGFHYIDLLRWMCGPASSIYAEARTAAHQRIEVEDVLCATIAFQSGAVASVMVSTSSYPAFPARLAIQGTKGGAVIEGDSLAALAMIGGAQRTGDGPIQYAIDVATGGMQEASTVTGRDEVDALNGIDVWTEGHRRQLLDFVDAVEHGRTPLVDGVEGRRTVELIGHLYSSARTGRVLNI